LQLDNSFTPGEYAPGDLAWSSDGLYLAARVYTRFGPQNEEVVAWKVATRQIVFRESEGKIVNAPLAFRSGGSPVPDVPLAFQPGSDNLAFVEVLPSIMLKTGSLEIWDVASGKLVQDYHQVGSGPLAWSPDGQYLAYADAVATNRVNIIAVSSGQRVYTYTGNTQPVGVLAWSPNGKYIVSGDELRKPGSVARVWTAE
jgi:WD40 repeat protein